MPSCCVVINCKNKYNHTKHVSFHKFPHHKMVLMKWIEFTGRKEWFPSRWSSICSRHFLPYDFRKHKSRKCLRPGAIPTILPANEPKKESSRKLQNLSLKPILGNDDVNKNFMSEDILNFENSPVNNLVEMSRIISDNLNKTIIPNNIENQQCYDTDDLISNNICSNKTLQIKNSDIEIQNIKETTTNTTSIKDKSFINDSVNISNGVISVQIICRLCGLNNVPFGSQMLLKNIEIYDMIEKCFPSFNNQLNDNNLSEICEECLNNLKEFSNFIDIVQKQQQNIQIENNYINRNEEEPRQTTKNTFNIEKNTTNIKIKQEPSTITTVGIKVKQEISDNSSFPVNSNPVLTNYEYGDTEVEQHQQQREEQNNETIDQKSSHFLNIPLINTEQVLKNCDVMEIISLDDAFIELIDDDVQIENNRDIQQQQHLNENYGIPTEAKIERSDYIDQFPNLSIYNIWEEHNYTRLINDIDDNYKRQRSDYIDPFPNLSIYNIWEEHNYTRLINDIYDNYKQEYIENDSLNLNKNILLNTPTPQIIPKNPAGIIVLNEDILKPAAPLGFNLYTCNDCGLPFFFEVHLIEHRRINHPESTYFCIICNSNFNKFIDLLKHRKICHKFLRKNTNKLKSCTKCGKNFISKLSLNNHRKYICDFLQKNRLFECKYCQMKFNKWIKLRNHEKICEMIKEEKTQSSIKIHQIPNSPPKIIENIQTVYPFTPLSISSKTFNTHYTLPIKSQIQKINYTCKICYRSYKSQPNLIRHSFVHDYFKNSNFKCDNCSTIFNELKDFHNHLRTKRNCRNTNKQKPLYNCLECGKKYKFYQGLQEHKSKIHSIIKPEYICTECKKVFNGVRNLKQHMQQHNNIRRKCPMCYKTFKQLSGLNQHKKAFHLNLKPHECSVCKRKYALKADMKRCRHSDKRLRHLKGYLSDDDIDD